MKMRAPSKEEAKALGQALAHADRVVAQTRNARCAPRCEFAKPDGERCGSPALREQSLCWQHREQLRRAPRGPRRRPQNGTQAALNYVMTELCAGRMDGKVAGALLYGLQNVVAKNQTNMKAQPKAAGLHQT